MGENRQWRRRGVRTAIIALLIVGMAGGALHALSWIRDMWTGPVVVPQTEPRTPPENTLSIDGPRIMNRREARTDLANPRVGTPAVHTEGGHLYATYCALCHGARGMGDGQLASFYRRMPDLTAPHVENYPDGFVYSIIREGGRNMPRFADALSVNERWALVHYLRTLARGAEAEAAQP